MSEPVKVGLLFDFDQGDGGRYYADGFRVGLEAVGAAERLGRRVELLIGQADGLPGGSAQAVVDEVDALVAQGAVVVAGPSISDNGIVVRDHVDRIGVPCVNYTGGAITRSQWMFHYQVGSLEEEPLALVDWLRRSAGSRRVALLHDDTPVGHNYALWFDRAVAGRPVGEPAELEVVTRSAVAPLADDLEATVRQATAGHPDVVVYLGLGVAARALALAVQACGWDGPVLTNSALMFGYSRKEWRAGWDGWIYVDTVSDANAMRHWLRARSKAHAASPIGLAAFDMGRLIGLGLALADDVSPAAVRDGLERVKAQPAASGKQGTRMGFGQWDHAALKGEALVLRSWRDGRSVEVDDTIEEQP
jgi:branched-chain amino acid transport system substrate-binding protein